MADELGEIIERLDRLIADGLPPGKSGALPASAAGSAPASLATAPPGECAPAPSQQTPADTASRWPILYETSSLLNSARFDLALVQETVVDIAIQLTRARRGFLFLRDDDGELELRVGRTDDHRPLKPKKLELPQSVVGRVVETREPIFIPNIADSPHRKSESIASLGLLSCMCVPLRTRLADRPRPPVPEERRRIAVEELEELLGVLYVDSNVNTYAFREEDLRFFLALADQATTAILNAQLYHQAVTDPLTRLHARRQFERDLRDACRRQEQRGAPFSFVMIDVDHFKRVNDRFGHLTGDAVLRELGAILRSAVRGWDTCYRYGGEELAVLLLDTDVGGARTTAEKIRRKVERHAFQDGALAITVSLGIATCPEHAKEPLDLVKRADQALYRAKEEGRNVSRVWTADIATTARRQDALAGIVTGNFATDYNNVMLLIDTFAALNSSMELNDLLVMTVDKVIEATGADRGALMLADERGSLATVVARDRRKTSLELGERFSRSVPQRVLQTKESVCVLDAADAGASAPPSASVAELDLRTIMCVPLQTKDKTLGVLYVDSKAVAGSLRESSLPFFDALARQVALAIENARLTAQLQLGKLA